jgi:TIR domain
MKDSRQHHGGRYADAQGDSTPRLLPCTEGGQANAQGEDEPCQLYGNVQGSTPSWCEVSCVQTSYLTVTLQVSRRKVKLHMSESSTVQNPGQSSAEAALSIALRDLREEAGTPSTRTIAKGVGGMSHTTVHAALTGTTLPSWPVLSKLVSYLGGDEVTFRQLWEDARPGGVSARRPTHGPEISVFVSYARIDDKASYGRISQLIDGLAATYESSTGQSVGVFRDVESIKPGDDWRDRIRLGLSASSIFLAFISPAYLRSAGCREELIEFFAFLNANSSTRLIIPLIFSSPDRILNEFSDDDLWVEVSKLQWLDISELRFADSGSGSWIRTLEAIADRISEVLRSVSSDADVPSAEPEIKTSSQGILERMAEIESRMPGMSSAIERYVVVMTRLGEEVGAATPAMQKADTFAKKLAVSERLASSLTPIAEEMDMLAGQLVSDLNELTYVTRFVTGIVTNSPGEATQDTLEFLATIRETADTGTDSLAAVDDFARSIGQALGYSKGLDKPLRRIRAANLKIADLRGIMSGWREEVDTVYERNPSLRP